jgi:hypothetical protein
MTAAQHVVCHCASQVIVEVVGVEGVANGKHGWFSVDRAVISYDHLHHALLEEASRSIS